MTTDTQPKKRQAYQIPHLELHQHWCLVTGESTGFNNFIPDGFLEQATDFMDGEAQ